MSGPLQFNPGVGFEALDCGSLDDDDDPFAGLSSEPAPAPTPRRVAIPPPAPAPAKKLTATSLIEQAKERILELNIELEKMEQLRDERDALARLVAASEA